MSMNPRRLEDRRLITGRGTYVDDLDRPDALACTFVRSPVAHGRIVSVDSGDSGSGARVFTAADLDLKDIPGNTGRGRPPAEHMTRPPLARDRVRHVGEAIAAVVAPRLVDAVDGAANVWVDIDELPASMDGSAPDLFDGGNLVDRQRLEAGEAGPEPEISVTVEVANQRLSPVTVEPVGILAAPTGGGGLEVWCGHQAPHRLANQLAMLLDLDRAQIRVVAPDVGGAFGLKGMLFPEYLVVAALASRLQQPIRWVQTRREQLVAGTHGRGQHHRVTIEGDADGRARRLIIDQTADTGAYPHNGSMIPLFSRLVACGLYDFERVEIDTTTHVSNRAPTGSYRGAGRPESALAIERCLDAFGRATGLDPFEVRLRNIVSDLPRTMPTGAVYDSGDYAEALRVARRLIDMEAVERRRRELDGSTRRLGVGVGAFIERAGGAADSWEFARVEVGDGEIVVRSGSADQGQGHATVWTQVTRAVLGDLPVQVVEGDTAEVADGVGTYGSRSAQIGAAGVHRQAHALLAEARQRAAEALEAAPDDVVYRDGWFSVAGVPDSGVSLWDVAGGLGLEERYSPGAQTFPYGVHAAVVEVDTETGEVVLDRMVAVDDCGTVLHPVIVEGQLVGSLAQGIGQALYEQVSYDGDGQPLTATMMDYPTPRAIDMPPITTARLTHPAPSNPLGVKGAGEAGCIGAPPAILNAVLDALAPLGVTELQLPLRPHVVWEAMRAAREPIAS